MDNMEPLKEVPAAIVNVDGIQLQSDDDQVQVFQDRVNEMSQQVVKLEQKVDEIEQFFSNTNTRKKQLLDSKNSSRLRDKQYQQAHNTNRDADASKRMQDLMTQFQTILNQLTQRKGVRSSVDSVDDDLGLHNIPEVAGKPKDLNSIRMRMEAKDGTGYTHVRDTYADVRLVLKNAMKHNNEKSDAHVTAKTLLAKFEEKWLQLLPKIMEEERREEDQGLKQQTYYAQLAKDVSCELSKVDLWLKEIKECVLQRHRRMSTLEKRELGRALTKLSADDLTKALEIVAQGNPAFQITAEEVDLDIDAQSESTLWRLKHFVVDILQTQGNNQSNSDGGDKNDEQKDNTLANKSNFKRKRETGDAFVKPAKNKTKKVSIL